MNISTYLKSESFEFYILITFKNSFELNDGVILHEIKFFKNKRELIDYIHSNHYLFFENPDDIQQDTIKKSVKLIKDYLSGKKINLLEEFEQLHVDLSLKQKFTTHFSLKVIQSLIKVNYGETTSYSTLGDDIGSKAYRAIGSVMSKNPIPLIIPCHRVLKKNGQIGGFMCSINDGWEIDLKKYLITMERTH